MVILYLMYFVYIKSLFRDAPKWKFLAEAEQNETGPKAKPNTVFRIFSPWRPIFPFFHHCIN